MSSNVQFGFLSRTKILFLFILLFAAVLISRLFLVQVVYGDSYSSRADRQYATASSDIFERGTIFFEHKDGQSIFGATQSLGYKIAINPAKILDPEATYEAISKIATPEKIEKEKFLAKAAKKDDPYEEVANRLKKEEADQISALKLPGVSVYKEKWRFYPGDNLASHTLGFVGYRGDELGGRYGLERQYEEYLSRSGEGPYVNFFAEVFSNLNKTIFDEPQSGNLVTTLEPEVQAYLEESLFAVKEKYGVDSIGGIIMNPQDGSIYAMAAKPDFNLNDFSGVKSASLFSNPLVENVFEFGSVMKPLVMAGALDAGVVTSTTKYEDLGSVVVEKKEIFNFDKKARGVVNMQEVLSQSLNTGMVFVYKKLGKERLHDYLLGFGIGEKAGIDLPNETKGLVSNLTNNLKNKREIEYANASFGQGIALTPINITRALAALANGGNLVTPHVVKKIKFENGLEKEIKYETVRAKITAATAEEITRMLVVVMDKGLQGGLTKLPNYSVAIKTGTAQVAKPSGGGYYEDRHTHSFFGYFPAYENPQFLIFLYAVNPKGVRYSSETWANPFLDITKFLINYYAVPPDR